LRSKFSRRFFGLDLAGNGGRWFAFVLDSADSGSDILRPVADKESGPAASAFDSGQGNPTGADQTCQALSADEVGNFPLVSRI
jgi:hypothetical protein